MRLVIAANRLQAIDQPEGARQKYAFARGQTVDHDFCQVAPHQTVAHKLALDSLEGAAILDALRPGFEDGSLKPFPVLEPNVYPLARAAEAYHAVLKGAPERVVLDPQL